jgi:hypothetical protein
MLVTTTHDQDKKNEDQRFCHAQLMALTLYCTLTRKKKGPTNASRQAQRHTDKDKEGSGTIATRVQAVRWEGPGAFVRYFLTSWIDGRRSKWKSRGKSCWRQTKERKEKISNGVRTDIADKKEQRLGGCRRRLMRDGGWKHGSMGQIRKYKTGEDRPKLF